MAYSNAEALDGCDHLALPFYRARIYYLFNSLGPVVGLADSTGALVGNETYHYDPSGLLIRQPRTAPLQVNPWRFAGGFYDTGTGLYKFGIRYYDPNIGRWTQRDPVGGSLTEMNKTNPYVYANDDPVNLVDPSGTTPAGACVLAALGGAAGTFLTLLKPVIGLLQSAPDIVTALAVINVTVSTAAVSWFIIGALFLAMVGGAIGALIAAKCFG